MSNNPNKGVPFVFKNGLGGLGESPLYTLCIELLNEGYSIHVIDSEEVSTKLLPLSESYDNRLKFFKVGTNPEGIEIKLW